jgi:preprotein translocase subunit YajC
MKAAPAGTQNTGHAVAPGSQPNDAIKQDRGFDWTMPLLIVAFIGFYFFLMRGQKKKEKERKNLLSEMKKGDKVQTIGGLVARVVSIDNDEVTLKIDESSNTKAVYKKAAIQSVIVPDDKSK